MSKRKSRPGVLSLILMTIFLVAGYFAWMQFFGRKVSLKDRSYVFIYLENKDTFEDLVSHLDDAGVFENEESFTWLAKKMDLPDNLHPGKYRVTNGMSQRQVINLFKYNKQEKIKLSFNSQIHTLDEFVQYVDDKLSISDSEVEDYLTDEEKLKRDFKLDPDNCFAMIVPATYEVSWAITFDELVDLMKARYNTVWNSARLAQCAKLGFSPSQITTIASIVQSESGIESEQEKIAGVYINRLKKNMPLQADPTLKFANGNFEATRVLDVDKETRSPYNTYKYKGLPPGPICLVGQQAIDATLNYSRHNFLYFCAKPQLNGLSDFSTTYEQHRKYASAYQKALDKIGINR